MRAFHYIAVILFFLPGILSAKIQVKATVDTTTMLIGDWIDMKLEVVYSEHLEVEWPFLPEKVGEFEIIKNTEIDSVFENGLIRESQQITITHFDSGYYAIPGMEFKYGHRDSKNKGKIRTDAILMTVVSLPIDTTQGLKPIKEIIALPFTWKEAVPYVLYGVGGLLALTALLFLIRRFRKKEEEIEEEKALIPPHITALEELKILEDKKLWQQGQVKNYYSDLTDILRKYIENRFDIPAMESTSDEIMESFKTTPVEQGLMEKLKVILDWADLAKFAKAQPSVDNNNRSLKNAEVFVQHTKNLAFGNIIDEEKKIDD